MGAGTPVHGVLLLDKAAGITSTRALAMTRRALDASKGGHTGTLDPFATGLLPLVFGEATKFSRFLIDSTKAYQATLRLGEVSETGDTESPAQRVSREIPGLQKIREVAASFVGDIAQIPPMHSAVHVDGRRLYEYARDGLTVERAPRQVQVFSLEILEVAGADATLRVVCSKGTYVRVLAADIGRALGCGAYLTALRRTAVGSLTLAAATPIEALQSMGPDEARKRLLPLETLVAGLPRVEIAGDAEIRFRHGQHVLARAPGGPVAVFGATRGFLGVGDPSGDSVAPLRLVAETPEVP
jgi:tRNA pseudouridine55 synthase